MLPPHSSAVSAKSPAFSAVFSASPLPRCRPAAAARTGPRSAPVHRHTLSSGVGQSSLVAAVSEDTETLACPHDQQRQDLERLFSAAQNWPVTPLLLNQQQEPEQASSPSSSTFHQQEAGAPLALAPLTPAAADASIHTLHLVGAPVTALQVQVGGPEPPKQKKELKERHDDFYANVGDAIRTLREDIPGLFGEDLNYKIYREDVVFRDPRNTFRGLSNYKTIFWSLRFHGRLFFKDLFVEVVRIWQKTDDTICMRWTVHGLPRLPWDAEGIFDGVSTYKLDSHGKIFEHRVDNVIFRDPPMLRIPFLARLQLDPVPARQPMPGAWFDGSGLQCVDLGREGPFPRQLTQPEQPTCSGL